VVSLTEHLDRQSAHDDRDHPFPGARVVAVVVSALGPELGGKVLSHFSAPEVEAIIREVKDLQSVPVSEVRSLLGRLRDEAVAQAYAVAGGVDRARELLRRSHGGDAEAILEQIMAAATVVPFQFLRGRRPDQIVSYLSAEHPQVIALVLAHLPLTTSARVIEGLSAELRAEVAERYAKLEAIDPAIVSEVEAALLRRVGRGSTQETNSTRGGVKPLAQLLNNVGRDTEKGVLTELERSDPELATAVRDLMFVFEDITSLDDRGLQELLRQSDPRTIALALKDANGVVREKIEGNLSKRAAEDVTEIASSLGMVRRSDVEAAQQEIVRIARRMEEEGKLMLVRGGGDGDFIA
jgi:flagellar motor switch protein FliG